ncbi:hypothetical protein BCR37DRAFT_377916 [Protomyces lactucae-debilis]|uniref:Uncharacterized protein n=1 Tax=Protomyces lactucae-debilis TaxID=2754530 RepID=A0A1Y2FN02_PROLT|nr:uncharacterized protein BCR37DRAFT_377916 [Protomyces lactucae-debilis]ORY84957.1 hypothetical protein BCR37DRAFT_377916 [Protomyces lactucae-debilis]
MFHVCIVLVVPACRSRLRFHAAQRQPLSGACCALISVVSGDPLRRLLDVITYGNLQILGTMLIDGPWRSSSLVAWQATEIPVQNDGLTSSALHGRVVFS